ACRRDSRPPFPLSRAKVPDPRARFDSSPYWRNKDPLAALGEVGREGASCPSVPTQETCYEGYEATCDDQSRARIDEPADQEPQEPPGGARRALLPLLPLLPRLVVDVGLAPRTAGARAQGT